MSEDYKYPRIDRRKFEVVSADEPRDRNYWLTRPVEERLEQIELLRRINYGTATTGRLQRVLEVVERKWC